MPDYEAVDQVSAIFEHARVARIVETRTPTWRRDPEVLGMFELLLNLWAFDDERCRTRCRAARTRTPNPNRTKRSWPAHRSGTCTAQCPNSSAHGRSNKPSDTSTRPRCPFVVYSANAAFEETITYTLLAIDLNELFTEPVTLEVLTATRGSGMS
jgi:hypothetical protein